MELFLIAACLVLAIVEAGLLVYLLVRRRWKEATGLTLGLISGAVAGWVIAGIALGPWLNKVVATPGAEGMGRGMMIGVSGLIAAAVGWLAAFVGALLLGLTGLCVGDRLARRLSLGDQKRS